MSRILPCLGLCLLSACGGAEATPQPVAPEPAPPAAKDTDKEPDTRWSTVRKASTVRSFEATGRLLAPANGRAELTLPLASTIVALRVAPGETLVAGQLVADIAIPEAARAQGELEGARMRSDAYAARLAQLEQLRGEGLARGADLAEARARLAEARASVREAEALLETLESIGIRRYGKRYQVVAPIAGVVIMVNAPVGASRGPSDGPLCVIAGGAATRVEARFGYVLPKTASYTLWSGESPLTSLRLLGQAPEVAAGDAARLAWFDASAPLALPPGSTVRVRIDMPDDAWVVPVSTLSRETPVRVRTARAGLVVVERLATLGSEALVRGPLQADDRVAEADAP